MAREFGSMPVPCGNAADAGTAHDPSNGQFTSGSGGSGRSSRKHVGKSGREYTPEELKKDYRTTHVGTAGSKGHWHPDVGHFDLD